MKLRNKLIPLASVFATGAVLAPAVLTSCSAGGLVDLTNGSYVPSVKKAKTDGYEADEDTAMDLWMAGVNENKDVLAQDKYWTDAALVKAFALQANVNVTSLKAQVKDISVKYVTASYKGTDYKIPTVSLTYTIASERNWYVTDQMAYYAADYASHETYLQEAAQLGAPLYYQVNRYTYSDMIDVTGNIYSNLVYECKWENIPVAFNDVKQYKSLSTGLSTDWLIKPNIDMLLYMDVAKLDWKYSVKYANEDTFVFDKDGTKSSKVYGSSLDRTFSNYYDLIYGPTGEEATSYTIGANLLYSEPIASFYLSDIKNKDAE